jgi:hypothetical protein
MLQGEVTRVYGRGSATASSPWYRSLVLFWPRFAFAAGIVVLLGGTLWMLNKGDGKETRLASNDAKPARQPEPAVANEFESRQAEADASANKAVDKKMLAAKAENPVRLREAVPPASPAPMNSPATVQAKDLNQADRFNESLEANRLAHSPAPTANRGLQQQLPRELGDDTRLSANVTAAKPVAAPQPKTRNQTGLRLEDGSPKPTSDLATSAQPSPYAIAPSEKASVNRLAGLQRTAEMQKASDPAFYATAAVTSWSNTFRPTGDAWRFVSGQGDPNLPYDDMLEDKLSKRRDSLAVVEEKNVKRPNGPDTDSDFAGGFARPGGDGRFAKAKSAASSKDEPVPASTAPAVGGGLAGAKSDSTLDTVKTTRNDGTASQESLNGRFGVKVANGDALRAEAEQTKQKLIVLDNFQLVQNGGAIRLVDADGSVYAGVVVPWDQSSQYLRGRVSTDANEAPALERFYRKLESNPVREKLSTVQSSNLVRFQVSGTNITTKQLVVVNGELGRVTLLSSSGIPGSLTGGGGAAGEKAMEKKQALEAENSAAGASKQRGSIAAYNSNASANVSIEPVRITGVALIGTNQIRLDAVRR